MQLMPQGERLLKPNLATHLVCGQLSGIALHAEHLMQRLTEACCQVRNTRCDRLFVPVRFYSLSI